MGDNGFLKVIPASILGLFTGLPGNFEGSVVFSRGADPAWKATIEDKTAAPQAPAEDSALSALVLRTFAALKSDWRGQISFTANRQCLSVWRVAVTGYRWLKEDGPMIELEKKRWVEPGF